MDRLPSELIDIILQFCAYGSRKNDVLMLRFVCRAFDRGLKPHVCRTLGLDFSRLNKSGTQAHPRKDALKTIGDNCKGLYIDMRLLRDKEEFRHLIASISILPHMKDFLDLLRTNYLMSDLSLTAEEYYSAVLDFLSHCRQVERLRLHFPSRLVRTLWGTAYTIFAKTIQALAERPKGSPALKVLILHGVPGFLLNRSPYEDPPGWGRNMSQICSELEYLSLTLDYYDQWQDLTADTASSIWTLIHEARLKSLCLAGTEPKPHCSLKQTRSQIMSPRVWRADGLSDPPSESYHDYNYLRRLELKGLAMTTRALLGIICPSKGSLEELYLNEIFLKVQVYRQWNADSTKELWTGIPNQRPPHGSEWIAEKLRRTMRKLRICRASFLGYDHYMNDAGEDISFQSDFDLVDPSGLGRSVSQRFVEIIMGVRQPNDLRGQPIQYLAKRSRHDKRFANLADRPARVRITDHDANAYQLEVDNTPRWSESLDGVFLNCNPGNQAEWEYISKTARDAWAEVGDVEAMR